MLNILKKELIIAMKAKDKDIKEVIQIVLSNVTNKRIELKRDLTDSEIIVVIKKEIKQIEETITYCDKREELKVSNIKKRDFLLKFVPAQMTVDEIYAFILANFDSSCVNVGVVMKKMMLLLKGKADNKDISKAVKEFFSKGE